MNIKRNKAISIEVKHHNKLLVVVNRVPINHGMFGNFNPFWIRYKGKEHYLHGGADYAYMHGPNPEGIPYYINI